MKDVPLITKVLEKRNSVLREAKLRFGFSLWFVFLEWLVINRNLVEMGKDELI